MKTLYVYIILRVLGLNKLNKNIYMDFKLQFEKTLDTTPDSIFYFLIKYKTI